jgi:DNA-binding response OmpR family regulator
MWQRNYHKAGLMNEDTINTALLIWQEDDLIKQQWILDEDEMKVGRDPTCQINLPSRWISRVHACLRRDGSGFLLEDASSKNGIYVNGQRIYKAHRLADGDKVQLAPGMDLIFVDSEATAPLPGRQVERLRLAEDERQVYLNGQLISPALSTQQYQILALLSEQPGKVYSRYEVITAAWPDDDAEGVSDDAVDAMIRRLRQRLGETDPAHDYIITVRGYGFKLNLED